MSKKSRSRHVAIAISAALTASAGATVASADSSLFSMTNLTTGYMVDPGNPEAGDKDKDRKKGEAGKRGEKKGKEGKCGEGKCGGEKDKKGEEGKCGEGKCGEGKCGGQH